MLAGVLLNSGQMDTPEKKKKSKAAKGSGGVQGLPVKLYISADPLKTILGPEDFKVKIPAIISFSIPDFGVMFRCRINAQFFRLTSLAAATALRFVEKSLTDAGVEKIELLTDSPGFYFAVTPQELDGVKHISRPDILGEYRRKFHLSAKLIDRSENSARFSCEALPQAPTDVAPALKLDANIWKSAGKMLPLQDGVDL